MLNKKEIGIILLITLILGFAVSFMKSLETFFYACSMILLVLLINIFAKKVTAFYLDSEIEIGIWKIQRYAFKPAWKLKKPITAGIIVPIIASLISRGYFYWMACLNFETKAKSYRSARRYGLYTFSEITEHHIGLIAASGILANLIFAIIGYLIGFPEFVKLNIYYAFFNMLPLWDFDGNKILFGNILIWSFLIAITLIAMGYAFLLI